MAHLVQRVYCSKLDEGWAKWYPDRVDQPAHFLLPLRRRLVTRADQQSVVRVLQDTDEGGDPGPGSPADPSQVVPGHLQLSERGVGRDRRVVIVRDPELSLEGTAQVRIRVEEEAARQLVPIFEDPIHEEI